MNEEFVRLSGYFKETPDDDMESCPLVEPNATPSPPSNEKKQRFVDLYPIQMMGADKKGLYNYSFDTYTLILQM
jgi:hypothetical protein